MSYVRLPPWYAVGTQINQARGVEEALALGGMDFEVIKQPSGYLTPDGTLTVVPNQFVLVRTDTKEPIVPVGPHFRVRPSRDVFAFTEHLLTLGLRYDATGVFGTRTFLSMVMPETSRLFEHDEYRHYLFVTNAHGVNQGTRCHMVSVRIASMAMFAEQPDWTPKGLTPQAEAEHTLTALFAAINSFEAQMNRLVATPITVGEFEAVAASMFDYHGGRVDEKSAEIADLFIGSPTMGPYGGTCYGALIAFAEWVDWYREIRHEKAQFTSSFDGTNGQRRARLAKILLSL